MLSTSRRNVTKFVSRRCSYWKTRLDQKKGRRHTTRRSSRANSWLGHRNPTFPVPADTTIKGHNNIYALLGEYPLLSLQLSVDLAKMPLPSDERFYVPRTHIYVPVLLPLLCPHTYLPPPKTIHEQSPDLTIKYICQFVSLNGRSFALKMSQTASRFNALAPNPYTVSTDKLNR